MGTGILALDPRDVMSSMRPRGWVVFPERCSGLNLLVMHLRIRGGWRRSGRFRRFWGGFGRGMVVRGSLGVVVGGEVLGIGIAGRSARLWGREWDLPFCILQRGGDMWCCGWELVVMLGCGGGVYFKSSMRELDMRMGWTSWLPYF